MNTIIVFFLLLLSAQISAQPAFFGAQGFGSSAAGGRGGQVIYVTNLNPTGPGSFMEALSTPGKRYILFKVSGVIDAVADITYGDVTIAGQTSPHGIVVRGILADEIFDTIGTADNIIIRHLRSRPHTTAFRSADHILDDGLRLDGASNIIIDHCSFANATDEAVQISRSRNVTIQNSILAETIGEHYTLGGMLINYSEPEYPLDSITVYHTLWNRIGGRYPEISNESPYAALRPLSMQFEFNLFWDQQAPMLYNANIDPSADPPIDSFFLRMNILNNRSITRPEYSNAMFTHSFLEHERNEFYIKNNIMQQYNDSGYSDVDLFYCCNDFNDSVNRPNLDSGKAQLHKTRLPFPVLPSMPGLRMQHAKNSGAFPRDSMDRRLLLALDSARIDTLMVDSNDYYKDAFIVDYDTSASEYPIDTDGDGMPDWWETHHGSDPNVQNHNDLDLAVKYNITPAHPNLELYLNRLSDSLITKKNTLLDTASKNVLDLRQLPVRISSNGTIVTVEVDNSSEYELMLIDIIGRSLFTSTFSTNFKHDFGNELPDGVYFVVLRNREGTFSQKIHLQ